MRFAPILEAESVSARAPLMGLSSPSRDNSPTNTVSDARPPLTEASAIKIPMAIGRSNAVPTFGRSGRGEVHDNSSLWVPTT